MSDPVVLKTLLADYKISHAIHTGEVSSPLIKFEFAPYKVSNHAFKPFVREQAFDAGELAIATFLQAKEFGKPLVLLPATISGRFQHTAIAYNIERGEIRPDQLNGKRIGVRAYTQTTGLWVRGILQNQFGVDLDSIEWLTFEEAHVAEYKNPPNVTIMPPDKKLANMLLEGELDAAMLGNEMPDDPRLRTVIPDPDAAAKEWWEQNHAVSMNHMMVVTEKLTKERPDVVAELFRVWKESKAKANMPLSHGVDMTPYGLTEPLRRGLELAIKYCRQQHLLSRDMSVEELFNDVTIGLS